MSKRIRRLLLLTVVLTGLLGMHVLGGGEHARHAPSPVAPAMAVGDGQPTGHTGLDQHTGIADQSLVVKADEPPHGSDWGTVLALCLAVLVVAGVTANLRRRAALLPVIDRSWRSKPVVSTRPGRGPPRDLLAELCVLRT